MVFTELKKLILGGAKAITDNKEQLNKMNVFPIPDGDTGTNMERTIMGAVRMYSAMGNRESEEEDFDELYRSILMSSQGNSGVILSQWFKGFLNSMKYAEEVSAISLNEAFLYAVESSYEAVINPVEGTMLTVAREAQEMAEEIIDEDTSVEEYLKEFIECAKRSLADTPLKLQVLQDAGVVDSGGMGFVLFASGMLAARDESISVSLEEFGQMDISKVSAVSSSSDVKLDEFGYCTELILQIDDEKLSSFSLQASILYLNEIGESVVAIQDRKQVKVHVHTLKPENVLRHFHEFGEFIKLKIENMSVQHNELENNDKKEKAVVAVVNGDGIASVMKEMGVDAVVDRHADSELSVGDISDAVKAVNAKNVLILLDDKNLHLLSVGIREVCKGINIHVIKGVSAADEYAAMSIFNTDDSFDSITENMEAAVAENTVCVIKKSEEVSDYNKLDIKPGDYMASVNGVYTSNFDNIADVLEAMLKGVENPGDKESIVVFCRDEQAHKNLEENKKIFEKYCPSAEIYILEGGQEENMYMISVQ